MILTIFLVSFVLSIPYTLACNEFIENWYISRAAIIIGVTIITSLVIRVVT